MNQLKLYQRIITLYLAGSCEFNPITWPAIVPPRVTTTIDIPAEEWE